VQDIWRNTVRNLDGIEIPIVPQHGDCKLENVLGDPQRPMQLRLLDWELWRPDGLPLLDLLHLLLSRRRRQSGYSIGGSICRWLLPGDFAPWEQALIDGLTQGLERQYVRAAPVLYWLQRVAPIVERRSWPHDGWAQANIEQVIERMKDRRAEVLA
jgi:aminoglycoside phosphotransferase (APT) family kinase protein